MIRFFAVLFQLVLCAVVCGDEADAPAIGVRPVAPGELTRLSGRLKDSDIKKACDAARELGDTRLPAAAPLLLRFYGESDGERRLAAVKALGELSVWSVSNKPETFLAIALGDISPAIRRQAARELALTEGVDAALKRFVNASADTKLNSALVRNRAIHYAGIIGGLRAAPFLIETLFSAEIEPAIAAAEELGESRAMSSVDALLKALRSDHAELKAAALAGLERLSGKTFKYDLVKWTEWRAALHDEMDKASVSVTAKDAARSDQYDYDASEKRPLDLVIAFDTTGSFLHIWPQVDQALESVLREIARNELSPRIGLVRYRAVEQRVTLRYSLQATPLTWNFAAIQKELSVASFGGGSGALHEGLRFALNGMVWRERSRKVIVLIGDDSPVSPVEDPMRVVQQLTHDAAVLDGILVNTLYAKTAAGDENRQTYRLIAFSGSGRFYEYNKAEKHLVEMSAVNVDVKGNELPAETARKWVTPRAK